MAAIAALDRRVSTVEATAGRIGEQSIRGDYAIANGTITAPQIQTGTITADLIDVSSLDAISANMGNLTSGNITLNAGSWMRTAPIGGSFAYTEFWSGGVRAQDAVGNETFNLSASTGILTAKMVIQTGTTVPLEWIGGGNLLPDASAEGANFTSIWNGVAATITTDSTFAFHGLKSAKLTCTGAANYSVRHSLNRVVVTPGKKYTASAYFRSTVANRKVRVYIDTYDSSGVRIAASSTGDITTQPGAWYRAVFTKAAESNAATAQIICEFIHEAGNPTSAGEIGYVDAMQLELGEVPTSFAPRPDEILPGTVTASHIYSGVVEADRIQAANIAAGAITAAKISATIAGGNLLSSATTSFENDIAGWETTGQHINSGATFARSTAQAYYGTASGLITTTAATILQGIGTTVTGPWRQGQTYTGSIYARPAAAVTCRLVMGDTTVTTDRIEVTAALTANVWQRVTAKWSPLADRTSMRFAFNVANTAIATTCYVDAAQVEHGDVVTAWRQYVAPAVIEGSSITAATYKTNLTGTRLQIDDAGGVSVYNSGIRTAQMRPGAGGLDLTASSSESAPSERRLRFLRESDSLQRGSVYLWETASGSDLIAEATNGSGGHAHLTIRTDGDYAVINATATDNTFPFGGTRKLLDSNFGSSFVQQTGSGQRTLACGSGTITFSNQNAATSANIAHGLNGTPTAVIATKYNGGSLYYGIYIVGADKDSTYLSVVAQTDGSFNTTGTVHFTWIAVL